MVVVGSAFGPSSAPNSSERNAISRIVIIAMIESLAIEYGKNGSPSFFRIAYSRRYASFSAWFTRGPHQISASGTTSGSVSAFSHGGAVIPSLVNRYRCAPISAMIRPGISSMWIA